jgi:hypothetical protein
MSIHFKKIQQGRKRFIKSLPIKNLNEFQFELVKIKDYLGQQTAYQIVGTKIYFEFISIDSAPRVMLEVVGVPFSFDKCVFQFADREAEEVFVHKLNGADLFNTSFSNIVEKAKSVRKILESGLNRVDLSNSTSIPAAFSSSLSEVFYIVSDNAKIELHFFSQKDYIQI